MGQAKKKKIVCPVVQRPIQPAECGTCRISTYSCPENCPQNPWSIANYDHQLEIQARTKERCISRLKEESIQAGRLLVPPDSGSDHPIPYLQFFITRIFRERDRQGTTFFERWKTAGFAGLNNDQAVMIKAMAAFFPAVLEIHQVMDDRQMLAVDLLHPERGTIRLVDHSLATTAGRFSTFLTFLFAAPCFYRIHSVVIPLPDFAGIGADEIVLEIVRHHGGLAEDPEKRDEWLFENAELFKDSLNAAETARYANLLKVIDAVYTETSYTLNESPEAVRERLSAHPNIHEEKPTAEETASGVENCWAWTVENRPPKAGRIVLCTILLYRGGMIVIQTTSRNRHKQAVPLFNSLLGKAVSFFGEFSRDLAEELIQKDQLFYDQTLVPDKLLTLSLNSEMTQPDLLPARTSNGESPRTAVKKTREQRFRDFVDSPAPLLAGKTPRQAAADPVLRPALLLLMKQQVFRNDQTDSEEGVQTDINTILSELQLNELVFPPPPLRARPPVEEEYDEEEEELEAASLLNDMDQELMIGTDAAQLGLAALRTENQDELIQNFLSVFPQIAFFLENDVFKTNPGIPPPFQTPILELAAQTAFLFFPQNEPPPTLSTANIKFAILAVMESVSDGSDTPPERLNTQPHVLNLTYQRIEEIFPPDYSKEKSLAMLFFCAFVSELHDNLSLMQLERLRKGSANSYE